MLLVGNLGGMLQLLREDCFLIRDLSFQISIALVSREQAVAQFFIFLL